MKELRQAGDRHRRFALAVKLVEARSENLQCAFQIGDIHRAAAVIDRAQIGEVGDGDLRRVDEPGQHRRRREHRDQTVPLHNVQDRCDLKMR